MNGRMSAPAPLMLSLAVMFLALGGCNKTELYSSLDEQEGNEMLALLLQHGVGSEKHAEKDNRVSLHVSPEKIPLAMELLRKSGYPRDKFSTIKDLFNADKLIASPYEDRTRFVYGMSQELADTLSRVDGVMTTRVHLVIPGEEDDAKVASAAVFIKHDPYYDLDEHIPQIRAIVASAIDGLDYESVNVALFPAVEQGDPVRLDREPLRSVLSMQLTTDSVSYFYALMGTLSGALFLSVVANAYLFWRYGVGR